MWGPRFRAGSLVPRSFQPWPRSLLLCRMGPKFDLESGFQGHSVYVLLLSTALSLSHLPSHTDHTDNCQPNLRSSWLDQPSSTSPKIQHPATVAVVHSNGVTMPTSMGYHSNTPGGNHGLQPPDREEEEGNDFASDYFHNLISSFSFLITEDHFANFWFNNCFFRYRFEFVMWRMCHAQWWPLTTSQTIITTSSFIWWRHNVIRRRRTAKWRHEHWWRHRRGEQ